ncbi:EpsG family protein [Providencia sp. PROV116]|uniref:EpsG family protein n=1 Tax=Providencia sp. PROV116 TaxID=2949827 RepID=UPI00234BEA8E|nr:EpsG family protein [Providencia sp. PROV116]
MNNNLKKVDTFTFITVLSIAILCLLPFSPYLSLILCFPLLTLLEIESVKIKSFSVFFILIFIILISYLGASRGIFETPNDDLADYYKNFIALSKGNLYALFEFGFGVEIGLPFLSFLLSIVAPYAPPRVFLLFHLIIINTLYVLFIYKYSKVVNIKYKSLLLLTCFLFLGYTAEANLLRQSYSSIFLLFALFSKNNKQKVHYIIISMTFHLSSILLYFAFNYIYRINLKKLLILLAASLLTAIFFASFILPILVQYPQIKIDAYINGDGVNIETILSIYKEFIIIFPISLFLFIINKIDIKYMYMLVAWFVITCILEFLMSGISLRINHMIITFLVGPILYTIFTKLKNTAIVFAFVIIPLIFILKIYSFVNNKNEMALFSDGNYFYSTPFEYVDFLTQDISNNKRDWKRLNYE